MTDRVASGSRRLDEVLGGGLPANAINLIIGQPGSGKTVLAQQYMFQNAEESRPGVYLSTVSEPLEKILRYGQALAFFDAAAIGRRIFYEDIGGVGGKDGLAGVLDRLKAIVRERQPAVLAIDSFKALGAYATTDAEFRRFLHELAGMLTAFPVTALWIGEYAEDDITTHPEFAVADSILLLDSRDVHERAARALKILKLRGSSFSSGRHAYRISSAGIDVFPRLADVGDHADYELGDHRISSGIDALDFMLATLWTSCSRTGIGLAHPPSSPGRPESERRSWVCTSRSTAPATASRASSRRSKRTHPSSSASSVDSAGLSPMKAFMSFTAAPSTSTSTNGSMSFSTPSTAPVPVEWWSTASAICKLVRPISRASGSTRTRCCSDARDAR